MTQPDPIAAAEARRDDQIKEYGTWEAATAINIGNARAFNEGDPVPVGHVERFGWDKGDSPLVRKQADATAGPVVPVVAGNNVVVNGEPTDVGAGGQGAVQADEQSSATKRGKAGN